MKASRRRKVDAASPSVPILRDALLPPVLRRAPSSLRFTPVRLRLAQLRRGLRVPDPSHLVLRVPLRRGREHLLSSRLVRPGRLLRLFRAAASHRADASPRCARAPSFPTSVGAAGGRRSRRSRRGARREGRVPKLESRRRHPREDDTTPAKVLLARARDAESDDDDDDGRGNMISAGGRGRERARRQTGAFSSIGEEASAKARRIKQQ
eukprot:31497-Pelagococcus_subviridis.AAC.76